MTVAWPENGDTAWNVAMKAFMDADHESDGTHTLATFGDFEITSITKDLTEADGETDVDTSLSATPRQIIFFMSVAGRSEASWGVDNGTLANCTFQDGNEDMDSSDAYSIYIEDTGGDYQRANVTATAANGFTITWDKSGTVTGTATITAICFT